MKYALNLAEDNRILSAWVVLPNGNYDGMPIVEELPEGDITDYRYINKQYVYDPKPVEPAPEPSPSLESRVATVEADVASLTTAIQKGLAL
jgi:hypothetical protein